MSKTKITPDRCRRCGGSVRLACDKCGYGGNWLSPIGPTGTANTPTLSCDNCGHLQPALCACVDGPL